MLRKEIDAMKIQLGCGHKKMPGYVNVDASRNVNPDQVWDLEQLPLPFSDSSVDEIVANHVLEHIHHFIPLMHDLWRICKPDALLKVRVPFYTAWGQFNDPTHVRFFTPFTFNYFCGKSSYAHEVGSSDPLFRQDKARIHFGIGHARKFNVLMDPLLNFHHKLYCRFFAWTVPASELEFELRVIKEYSPPPFPATL